MTTTIPSSILNAVLDAKARITAFTDDKQNYVRSMATSLMATYDTRLGYTKDTVTTLHLLSELLNQGHLKDFITLQPVSYTTYNAVCGKVSEDKARKAAHRIAEEDYTARLVTLQGEFDAASEAFRKAQQAEDAEAEALQRQQNLLADVMAIALNG